MRRQQPRERSCLAELTGINARRAEKGEHFVQRTGEKFLPCLTPRRTPSRLVCPPLGGELLLGQSNRTLRIGLNSRGDDSVEPEAASLLTAEVMTRAFGVNIGPERHQLNPKGSTQRSGNAFKSGQAGYPSSVLVGGNGRLRGAGTYAEFCLRQAKLVSYRTNG